MLQQLRARDFGQIRWNILRDLGSDSGVQLRNKLMVDFSAGREEARFDFRIQRQLIDLAGELADRTFSLFERNVVAFAVRHGVRQVGIAEATGKTARKIGHLVHQPFMRTGDFKLGDGSETRYSIESRAFQLERFQAREISDNQQCVLHNSFRLVPALMAGSFPC